MDWKLSPCLKNAHRQLHSPHAQLLSSCQEAAKVLLPVQVHPQLFQRPCHALSGT